jgi:hypothetical protein
LFADRCRRCWKLLNEAGGVRVKLAINVTSVVELPNGRGAPTDQLSIKGRCPAPTMENRIGSTVLPIRRAGRI